jgi:hypothetical protein
MNEWSTSRHMTTSTNDESKTTASTNPFDQFVITPNYVVHEATMTTTTSRYEDKNARNFSDVGETLRNNNVQQTRNLDQNEMGRSQTNLNERRSSSKMQQQPEVNNFFDMPNESDLSYEWAPITSSTSFNMRTNVDTEMTGQHPPLSQNVDMIQNKSTSMNNGYINATSIEYSNPSTDDSVRENASIDFQTISNECTDHFVNNCFESQSRHHDTNLSLDSYHSIEMLDNTTMLNDNMPHRLDPFTTLESNQSLPPNVDQDEDDKLLSFLHASLTFTTGNVESCNTREGVSFTSCQPLPYQSQELFSCNYASVSSVMEPELATVLESNTSIYDDSDALNAAAIQAALDEDLFLLSLDRNKVEKINERNDDSKEGCRERFSNPSTIRIIEADNNTQFEEVDEFVWQQQQESCTSCTATIPSCDGTNCANGTNYVQSFGIDHPETEVTTTYARSFVSTSDHIIWEQPEVANLNIEQDSIIIDCKPAAVEHPGDLCSRYHVSSPRSVHTSDNIAVAEVLDIQDDRDVHPDDDSIENEVVVEAHLIGRDDFDTDTFTQVQSDLIDNMTTQCAIIARHLDSRDDQFAAEMNNSIHEFAACTPSNVNEDIRNVEPSQSNNIEATILEITNESNAHYLFGSSILGTGIADVEAELVGQDESYPHHQSHAQSEFINFVDSNPDYPENGRTNCTSAYHDNDTTTAEAAVIDSGPIEKDFLPYVQPGVAETLIDFNACSYDDVLDQKPAAVERTTISETYTSDGTNDSRTASLMITDNIPNAEVIDFHDEADIHPDDDSLPNGFVVDAEFVGHDLNSNQASQTFNRSSHPIFLELNQATVSDGREMNNGSSNGVTNTNSAMNSATDGMYPSCSTMDILDDKSTRNNTSTQSIPQNGFEEHELLGGCASSQLQWMTCPNSSPPCAVSNLASRDCLHSDGNNFSAFTYDDGTSNFLQVTDREQFPPTSSQVTNSPNGNTHEYSNTLQSSTYDADKFHTVQVLTPNVIATDNHGVSNATYASVDNNCASPTEASKSITSLQNVRIRI